MTSVIDGAGASIGFFDSMLIIIDGFVVENCSGSTGNATDSLRNLFTKLTTSSSSPIYSNSTPFILNLNVGILPLQTDFKPFQTFNSTVCVFKSHGGLLNCGETVVEP